MATTNSRRPKVNAFTILMLITSIIPILLEFLNSGEPKATVEFEFQPDSQRLRAKVNTPDSDGSKKKSIVQR